MHRLDRSGHPAVHQFLAGQGCEGGPSCCDPCQLEATEVLPNRAGETLDGQVVAPSWKFGSSTVWDGHDASYRPSILLSFRT
jgi:hypothetical protein